MQLVIINVYMPTNYGDDASLHSYIDYLSKIEAILVDTNATKKKKKKKKKLYLPSKMAVQMHS